MVACYRDKGKYSAKRQNFKQFSSNLEKQTSEQEERCPIVLLNDDSFKISSTYTNNYFKTYHLDVKGLWVIVHKFLR